MYANVALFSWVDGFKAAMKDSDAMTYRVDSHQRQFIVSTTSRRSSMTSALDVVIRSNDDVTNDAHTETTSAADAVELHKRFSSFDDTKQARDDSASDVTNANDDDIYDDVILRDGIKCSKDMTEPSSTVEPSGLYVVFNERNQGEEMAGDSVHGSSITCSSTDDAATDTDSIYISLMSDAVAADQDENCNSSYRSVGVQVVESELQPTKSRVQALKSLFMGNAASGSQSASSLKSRGLITDATSNTAAAASAEFDGDDDDDIITPVTGANASMYRKNSCHSSCQTRFRVVLTGDTVDDSSC